MCLAHAQLSTFSEFFSNNQIKAVVLSAFSVRSLDGIRFRSLDDYDPQGLIFTLFIKGTWGKHYHMNTKDLNSTSPFLIINPFLGHKLSHISSSGDKERQYPADENLPNNEKIYSAEGKNHLAFAPFGGDTTLHPLQ